MRKSRTTKNIIYKKPLVPEKLINIVRHELKSSIDNFIIFKQNF